MEGLEVKSGGGVTIIIGDTVLVEICKSEIGLGYKQTVLTGDFSSDFGVVNSSSSTGQRRVEARKEEEDEEDDSDKETSEDERGLDSGDDEIVNRDMLQ